MIDQEVSPRQVAANGLTLEGLTIRRSAFPDNLLSRRDILYHVVKSPTIRHLLLLALWALGERVWCAAGCEMMVLVYRAGLMSVRSGVQPRRRAVVSSAELTNADVDEGLQTC